MLSKVHFWLLFIGVRVKGRKFYLVDAGAHSEKKHSDLRKSNGNSPFTPNDFVMYFENVKTSKSDIYNSLRNKSGVYIFINNVTKDLYVGSSINLTKRMTSHFFYANSDSSARFATKSVVSRAMNKYKLENFSLGIIELCEKNVIVCTNLEQKWIDHYQPSYNILKVAGSSFGFTHKISTIAKLKELFKKDNHPKFGTTTSSETKESIKREIKNFYLNNAHPYKGKKGVLSPQYGIGGSLVFCYTKDSKELMFPSINAARQHFKVRWTHIKKIIDTGEYVCLNGDNWIIQSMPRDPNKI